VTPRSAQSLTSQVFNLICGSLERLIQFPRVERHTQKAVVDTRSLKESARNGDTFHTSGKGCEQLCATFGFDSLNNLCFFILRQQVSEESESGKFLTQVPQMLSHHAQACSAQSFVVVIMQPSDEQHVINRRVRSDSSCKPGLHVD